MAKRIFCNSLLMLATVLSTLTGSTYLWGETKMPDCLQKNHKE